MLERVILATIAMGMVLRVNGGEGEVPERVAQSGPVLREEASRMKKLVTGSSSTPMLNLPDMGRRPRYREKMSMSTRPSQKMGMLTPRRAPSMLR